MLYFSKLKITLIAIFCCLALFYAAPSFMKSESEFLPNKKVNLGLDLRGGSHLLMEVDFAYYLNEQINNLRGDIRAAFRDESIRTLPVVSISEKEDK